MWWWRLRAAGMTGAMALLLAACTGRPGAGGGPTPTPTPTGNPMVRLQAAVNRYSSYAVKVQEYNLVLPHWGGVNGGTVNVYNGGNVVVAQLGRTGESGATYRIELSDGHTYFQRSTCNTLFRVPGGPGDVLEPFILTHGRLAGATNVGQSGGLIEATLPSIGQVTIAVDATSGLPARISGFQSGQPLVWTFSDWGHATKTLGIPPNVTDRGPGGNPC